MNQAVQMAQNKDKLAYFGVHLAANRRYQDASNLVLAFTRFISIIDRKKLPINSKYDKLVF